MPHRKCARTSAHGGGRGARGCGEGANGMRDSWSARGPHEQGQAWRAAHQIVQHNSSESASTTCWDAVTGRLTPGAAGAGLGAPIAARARFPWRVPAAPLILRVEVAACFVGRGCPPGAIGRLAALATRVNMNICPARRHAGAFARRQHRRSAKGLDFTGSMPCASSTFRSPTIST